MPHFCHCLGLLHFFGHAFQTSDSGGYPVSAPKKLQMSNSRSKNYIEKHISSFQNSGLSPLDPKTPDKG